MLLRNKQQTTWVKTFSQTMPGVMRTKNNNQGMNDTGIKYRVSANTSGNGWYWYRAILGLILASRTLHWTSSFYMH